MAGEWHERPLGALTENFDSVRVPVKEVDRRAGPFPYYGASGVVDYVDNYLFDGEYLLVAEDGENLRTRNTPVAFLARGKFWVNNHAHIVRGNDEADTRFLMYALSASDISGYLTGSTMPKLTQGNMNRIPLLTPPLPEQRAIAHILGTLDDKIELNQRMNATLEAMARALFNSWFVDFDPVRAKMEGRDTGLPREIADLFPDGFEESAVGEVPVGWSVSTIASIAPTLKGSVMPGKFPTKVWEHYSIPAFDAGRVPALETGDTIKSGKYRVPSTCVLVSKLNPQFPRVWYPNVEDEEAAICSTEFIPFVPRHPEWRTYLYELMKSDSIQSAIAERVTGSTGSRQRAKPDDIASIAIVVPPQELLHRFCQLASPMHERNDEAINESRTLAALRDTLLPKLISGEVRVGDAERFVGAAA